MHQEVHLINSLIDMPVATVPSIIIKFILNLNLVQIQDSRSQTRNTGSMMKNKAAYFSVDRSGSVLKD